jgi:hypothetical protein
MGMMGLMEKCQGQDDEKTGEEERAHAGAFAKLSGRNLTTENEAVDLAKQMDLVEMVGARGFEPPTPSLPDSIW